MKTVIPALVAILAGILVLAYAFGQAIDTEFADQPPRVRVIGH